ncbi:MAG TPA: hypothetical protein VLV56_04870 [Burkholderiales bacterium]|nr:hypothetical protein [Burkholderiales bacterium]
MIELTDGRMQMPQKDEGVLEPGYQLTLEHRPGYLYAYVRGSRDSVEIDYSYFGKIAEECRKHGCKRVLIEEDLETQLSATEMYEATSSVRSLYVPGVKVAFVDRRPSHRPGNLFGQLVATNRGVWVRVCDSVEDAQKWLLES